jgi:hypothetical protein
LALALSAPWLVTLVASCKILLETVACFFPSLDLNFRPDNRGFIEPAVQSLFDSLTPAGAGLGSLARAPPIGSSKTFGRAPSLGISWPSPARIRPSYSR